MIFDEKYVCFTPFRNRYLSAIVKFIIRDLKVLLVLIYIKFLIKSGKCRNGLELKK